MTDDTLEARTRKELLDELRKVARHVIEFLMREKITTQRIFITEDTMAAKSCDLALAFARKEAVRREIIVLRQTSSYLRGCDSDEAALNYHADLLNEQADALEKQARVALVSSSQR